jgi:hypothetical protein
MTLKTGGALPVLGTDVKAINPPFLPCPAGPGVADVLEDVVGAEAEARQISALRHAGEYQNGLDAPPQCLR